MLDSSFWPEFLYSAASAGNIGHWAPAIEDLDYSRLPKKDWTAILLNLDVESRLSIAALGKGFEALNYSDRALRTVRCGATSGVVALTRTLKGERSKCVRVLCLTNCFLAEPHLLLGCVAMCEQLAELQCVGCPLNTRHLFRVIALRLHKLERLEFSLFCDKDSRCKKVSCSFSDVEASEPRTLTLRCVYVDVRCSRHWGFELLFAYLRRCPNLNRLHVHTLRGAHALLAPHCAVHVTSALNSLDMVTYTTDENVQEMCREFEGVPERQRPIVVKIATCGNTAIYLKELRPSSPTDGIRRLRLGPLHGERLKQVQLFGPATTVSARRLKQVAESASWSHVSDLTMISSPKVLGVRPVITCAPPEFKEDLVSFFQAFRAITELNLNAFYFSEDLGFSAIAELSGLDRLRALAVAPCALRGSRYPMEHLGFACPRLEELDVRSNLIGDPAFPCLTCHSEEPFMLSQQGVVVAYWLSCLFGAAGLQTLTLYKVSGLYFFSFLTLCRVTELRLSGVDTTSLDEFIRLGGRLCANLDLAKLAIEHPDLPMATRNLWTELSKLSSLRFLCLKSESKCWQKSVVIGAETVLHALPLMEGLHVHFQLKRRAEKISITWLKIAARNQSLSRGVSKTGNFKMLVGKSCVQCSLSSFVGNTSLETVAGATSRSSLVCKENKRLKPSRLYRNYPGV